MMLDLGVKYFPKDNFLSGNIPAVQFSERQLLSWPQHSVPLSVLAAALSPSLPQRSAPSNCKNLKMPNTIFFATGRGWGIVYLEKVNPNLSHQKPVPIEHWRKSRNIEYNFKLNQPCLSQGSSSNL